MQLGQVNIHPGQQFFPQQNFGLKMPTVKDMKLPIQWLSGKEDYRGLGARLNIWGLQFLDELGAAQQLSGGEWPEELS